MSSADFMFVMSNTYNTTCLVTNKVYADGKGPTYNYTPNGKPATRTWARGITTDYAYDGWGNLINTVYSDGTPTISLAYNRAGRQTRAEDAVGVTMFRYDEFGSLTNETVIGVAGTNTIIRHWDNFGRSLGYSLVGVPRAEGESRSDALAGARGDPRPPKSGNISLGVTLGQRTRHRASLGFWHG